MLNVVYYFYYHLDPLFPKEEVIKSIKNKDYDKFIDLYNEWHVKNGFFYMPKEIYVYTEENSECPIVANLLDRENFKQITHAEYECG